MLLFPSNAIDYVPHTRMLYSAETPSQTEEFCATDINLNDLRFGDTEYKFLQEIKVQGVWNCDSNEWACWSSDLGGMFFGKGDTLVSAFDDFKNQLHTIFQRLYRNRPFEMDTQEQEQWNRLINVIDVHRYRTTTPIVVREVGQISYGMISRPYRIKWLTGYNYIIDPGRVPPELMSLKPGRYIEAVVKRDPITHKEIEILSVQPISFHLPNDAEARRIWDNIPAADLPTGGWD